MRQRFRTRNNDWATNASSTMRVAMILKSSTISAASAAVLIVMSGASSAATVTFADMSLSGSYRHAAARKTKPAATPAKGTVGGVMSGQLYGDTSAKRSYTLTYYIDTTSKGVKTNTVGSYAIPDAFSIKDMLAAYVSVISPTGTGMLPVPEFNGSFNYNNVRTTPATVSGSFSLSYSGNGYQDFIGSMGLPTYKDNTAGSYTANFALVADVVDVAPVPVPAAAPMLAFGIAGLVALRRKRRKAA